MALTQDPVLALERFRRDGITTEDKHTFLDAMERLLASTTHTDSNGGAFAENISQAADALAGINKGFRDVSDMFTNETFNLSSTVGITGLFQFLNFAAEWKQFSTNWAQDCLSASHLAARVQLEALTKFDSIYLHQIENIQTEQDRLDAMKSLEEFIENHQDDHSADVSRAHLKMKRDISDFLSRFETWVSGLGLRPMVSVSQPTIIQVTNEIAALNKEIQNANNGLAYCGGWLNFMVPSEAWGSSVLLSLQAQKAERLGVLRNLQAASLIPIKEIPLLILQDKLRITSPDIDMMSDRLIMIAEIWLSARSQAVQFRAHIAGGLEAATDSRFKLEVKLARSVCVPLMDGLETLLLAILTALEVKPTPPIG